MNHSQNIVLVLDTVTVVDTSLEIKK